MQNVIYFLLDVGYQIDISHDQNLEDFLAAIGDNSKHKAVVWMKEPLIEKGSGIQHSKVSTPLDVGNDFRLERQGIGVGENHVVELSYVNYRSAFPFALSIKLPNNEEKEDE